MLEEKKILDKIEIVGDIIQIRERNAVFKDEVEIASTFHRYILTKNDDLTNRDPKIVAIANVLWNTQE